MRYLVLLLIPFIFSTCRDIVKTDCPYELEYSGHFLRIPVTITPHQMTYNVGDTMRISTIFSDSIQDIGTNQTFKIEGFPFTPITLLYRFYDGMKWDAGYRVNESYVDSIYQPNYNFSSSYADSYRAKTIYEDGMYKFELEVVLKEKGRYVLVFSDKYQDYNASGNQELNAEADSITFEGKCDVLGYYLCSMIEGEAHLESFMDEIKRLDSHVYGGKLRIGESSADQLGAGSLSVEWNGFFGFEVVD